MTERLNWTELIQHLPYAKIWLLYVWQYMLSLTTILWNMCYALLLSPFNREGNWNIEVEQFDQGLPRVTTTKWWIVWWTQAVRLRSFSLNYYIYCFSISPSCRVPDFIIFLILSLTLLWGEKKTLSCPLSKVKGGKSLTTNRAISISFFDSIPLFPPKFSKDWRR